MGQQQLLLVILVTIIVGIATVVAINTFGTAADQANIDAVNNDIATLASAAQGFYMRPEMLGGGGRTFNGLTFEGLAFPTEDVDNDSEGDSEAVNENGRYYLEDVGGSSFTIRAYPSSNPGFEPGIGEADGEAAGAITAGVSANNFELGETASTIGS